VQCTAYGAVVVVRGRLLDAAAAPASGEDFARIVDIAGVRIEQILSSAEENPTIYVQDHDEWVVVLAGGADLDVGGEAVTLAPGEWVLLPATVPHRVTRTDAGTSWLAVHAPA